MSITDIRVNNWKHPGDLWWKTVEAKPDDQLIDATFRMVLSFREYKALLDMNRSPSLSDNCESQKVLKPAMQQWDEFLAKAKAEMWDADTIETIKRMRENSRKFEESLNKLGDLVKKIEQIR